MEGADIRLEYLSPVMRAQQQSEARAIMNTWAAAGQLAAVNPTVPDNLDPDTSIRLIAAAEGVPPEVLISEGNRDEIREMRAAQQQEQAAAAEFSQGAEAAGQALPGIAKIIEATQPQSAIPAA